MYNHSVGRLRSEYLTWRGAAVPYQYNAPARSKPRVDADLSLRDHARDSVVQAVW